MIHLFPKDDTILNTAASVEPSYACGKVISVPKTKKGTNHYGLRYDKDHHSPEEMNKFTTKVIVSKAVKKHLKRAFGLANREGYCFGGVKKKRKKQMTATEATPLACPGTIIILGLMHKRNISSHAASAQSLGKYDNKSDDK
eukprot:11688365-Ditylum_brightwellii.AAC.1